MTSSTLTISLPTWPGCSLLPARVEQGLVRLPFVLCRRTKREKEQKKKEGGGGRVGEMGGRRRRKGKGVPGAGWRVVRASKRAGGLARARGLPGEVDLPYVPLRRFLGKNDEKPVGVGWGGKG